MIECEVRAFISKEKYEELLEFFEKNSQKIKEDFQETWYFDSKIDLRTQRNDFHSKIWMKKGKIHDDAREEIEILFDKEDFEKINSVFNDIGLNIEIKWFRERREFLWKGITVCVDYTKGYGYIVELEKLTQDSQKDKAIDELREMLKSLKVNETSKEEFNNQYEYYKKNWRSLI